MGIEDQYLEEFGAVGSVTAAAQNKQRLWFREVFVAAEIGTTATTWATQATLYLGTPAAGKFLVNWSFEANNTTTNKGCDHQILCNGSLVWQLEQPVHLQEVFGLLSAAVTFSK